ncbi:hypothetical protein [Ralstonia sp. 24A2]|uniref:hypothetical protein n=1 Tax=Ralstonia sp. 24A2 TaxID=3447364 RepID=UPI003F69D7A0
MHETQPREQVNQRRERTGFAHCRARCLPHPEELPPHDDRPQASSANRQTIFSVVLFRIIDGRCAYSFSLSNVVIKCRLVFTKYSRSALHFNFSMCFAKLACDPKKISLERVFPGQKLQEIGQRIAACELKNFVSIQRTFPPESVHP